MADRRVILVSGVANFWGGQVAAGLISEAKMQGETEIHVLGLDREPPDEEIQGLDFIQADVCNPLLAELLRSEEVHTVCHLDFHESVRPTDTVFDFNVIGTMKVLGACAEAGVNKVVLKSSMAVYGALPSNPAFLTEQRPIKGALAAYAYNQHLAEIESFCNGFRRQTPEMILTILRFPSIIGLETDTPMTRFLKNPLAAVLLGFDPLMQVIHEKDVIQSLLYAVIHDVPGVFNVAAEGILPLSRLMALAAKIPLPVPHFLAYWGANFMNSTSLLFGRYWPIEPDYLRYPWVGDLALMRDQLGFTPRYTAEEALREFAGEQRVRRYMPEAAALAYDEERLRDTLERRKRARTLSIAGSDDQGEEEVNE